MAILLVLRFIRNSGQQRFDGKWNGDCLMAGVWVDVFDVAGDRLGDGPVNEIQSVEVNRQLDGAGTFTIRAMVSARSISLFTNEKRVKIYNKDAGGVRLIGQGIIEKVNITESTPGVSLRVSGPDILHELVRKNTLRARLFSQATLQTVADGLIALVPGWSVVVDAAIASKKVDARYDGASVLKAFRDLAERYKYHFRLSNDDRVVTISRFGEVTGKRVFPVQVITPAMIRDPNLLFVQRLPQTTETNDLANWIIPLGAGEGVGQLTIEKSTRTAPYTIQNLVGPDGTLQYFISDAPSVAAYGQIETMKSFKQIAALSNSDTDIINAANALYDAAAEWLDRNKSPIVRYALTVKNVKVNMLPGDKVHVNYKGQIITPRGETVDYLTVRDDFWVMRAVERIGLEEHSVDLEVANIDQRVNSVAERVADSIEDIKLRDLKPTIGPSVRSYVYNLDISAAGGGFTALIPVEFTDATLDLQRVRFRLKTSPFRANVTSAAADGDHRHKVFASEADAAVPGDQGYVCASDSGGIGSSHVAFRGPNNDLWTNDSSGTHVHPITYGIFDDSVSPKNVTVFVNGVDKTTELFGFTPLAPAGANLDVVADVGVLTNLILNAAGGLRQEHTIEVKCADQQGRVEATVEIFEINQSVKIV